MTRPTRKTSHRNGHKYSMLAVYAEAALRRTGAKKPADLVTFFPPGTNTVQITAACTELVNAGAAKWDMATDTYCLV